MDITKEILLKLADEFSLARKTLTDRIRLQKLIYLLQASGLKLGYGFRWYNYGPYSQELTQDAFNVLRSGQRSIIHFDNNVQKKLGEFKGVFGTTISDAKLLELVASIDYVRQYLQPDITKDTIVGEFKKLKVNYFDDKLIPDSEIKKAFELSDKVRALQNAQLVN